MATNKRPRLTRISPFAVNDFLRRADRMPKAEAEAECQRLENGLRRMITLAMMRELADGRNTLAPAPNWSDRR